MAMLVLLWGAPAHAACPAGQQALLTARLYFGQSVDGRKLSAAAWRDFVARTVTPRFADGFTEYDAAGQWRDPRTHRIAREATKVIEIAAADTRDFRDRIDRVRNDYAARFHQQSVGLLMLPACGTF